MSKARHKLPVGSTVVYGLELLWQAFQAEHPEIPDVFISISYTDPLVYGWSMDDRAVALPLSSLGYPASTLTGVLLHEATHQMNAALQIEDVKGYYHLKEFLDAGLALGLAHPKVRHPRWGWTTIALTPATGRLYSAETRNLQAALRGE